MHGICCARSLVMLGCVAASALSAQQEQQATEGLSGPYTHEQGPQDRGHLLGEWKGNRERLLERGVDIDLQYISDSLWNFRWPQEERLASWNQIRGTVNLDFSRLTDTPGLMFHITGLWQTGGNLGGWYQFWICTCVIGALGSFADEASFPAPLGFCACADTSMGNISVPVTVNTKTKRRRDARRLAR